MTCLLLLRRGRGFATQGEEMKYMVSVSGGAGSTLAAHRTVAKYGAQNTVLVFADTNGEDDTLYAALRYMKDVALKECEFVWLTNDGKTIWDVFCEHKIMRLQGGGCKAAFVLKHRALDAYADSTFAPGTVVRVSGLDRTEDDRIMRFDARIPHYKTWHPLSERPYLSACQKISEMERLGYPSQHLYEKGYPHNNCGGACILAGASQWAGLLQDNRERFLYAEREEQRFLDVLRNSGREEFTVLKDRRGGTTKNMTLKDFRERVESGDTKGLRDFRSTCGCMT